MVWQYTKRGTKALKGMSGKFQKAIERNYTQHKVPFRRSANRPSYDDYCHMMLMGGEL